jgi:hypothetical protein
VPSSIFSRACRTAKKTAQVNNRSNQQVEPGTTFDKNIHNGTLQHLQQGLQDSKEHSTSQTWHHV